LAPVVLVLMLFLCAVGAAIATTSSKPVLGIAAIAVAVSGLGMLGWSGRTETQAEVSPVLSSSGLRRAHHGEDYLVHLNTLELPAEPTKRLEGASGAA
jgi:hypothetical protein